MPHFFVNSNSVESGVLRVDEPETLRHLGILRVKEGESLKFIDENGIQYFTKAKQISKNEGIFEVQKAEKSMKKLDFEIHLAGSVLKTDAQNLAVQNATELGIKGFWPFISDFSTVKADFARNKAEKWQKIADESFKQCERADRMRVFDILPLKEILKNFKKENVVVFAEKCASCNVFQVSKEIFLNEKILVIVGPEGGFSDSEFDFFEKSGFKMATLGNLIFRAPNAVTAGISNLIMSLKLLNEAESCEVKPLQSQKGGGVS